MRCTGYFGSVLAAFLLLVALFERNQATARVQLQHAASDGNHLTHHARSLASSVSGVRHATGTQLAVLRGRSRWLSSIPSTPTSDSWGEATQAFAAQLETFAGISVSWVSPAPDTSVSSSSSNSGPTPPTNSPVWQFEIAPLRTPAGSSGSNSNPTESSGGSGSSSSTDGVAGIAGNSTNNNSTTYNSTNIQQTQQLVHASSDSDTSSSSQLSPHVNFTYTTNSSGNPLSMPVMDTPGLNITRWVMCAWSVSNFSSPQMLNDRTMYQVQELINNFTAMAPGQVQLAATANVTLAFVFRGVKGWSWEAASNALRQAASDTAGGFDPQHIAVLRESPDYGMPAAEFANSKRVPVTERPENNLTLTSSGGRRLHRRLLQLADSTSSTTSSSDAVQVWVAYSRLAPLNVTALLGALSASSAPVVWEPDANLTNTTAGRHTRQLLSGAGVDVSSSSYAQLLEEKPMVSLSIRLAIGITPTQAAANTDRALATWLSQPRNIHNAIQVSGVPDPIGPNALTKWLLTPEIWFVKASDQVAAASGLQPAQAAGVAVGCIAAVALAAGLVMVLLRRRRQEQQQQAAKAEAAASSEQRRRRRQGKRRYLLPEPPPPAADPAPTSAASAASAAGALVGLSVSPGSAADAADGMTPDQIRPAMKELGDSVTSAVRFEIDDDEADDAAAANDTAAAGNASASQRVLAARAALLAEQQAGGASSTGDGPSAAVLADVAGSAEGSDCLVSTRGGWVPGTTQQQQQKHLQTTSPSAAEGAVLLQQGIGIENGQPSLLRGSGGSSSSGGCVQLPPSCSDQPAALPCRPSPRSFPLHSLPASPEPADDSEPSPVTTAVSAVESSTAATAAGAAVPAIIAITPLEAAVVPAAVVSDLSSTQAAAAGGSPSALPGPPAGQPLDLTALGISISSCSPLQKPGGKARASPFAMAYNFGDLADSVPAVASCSSSAMPATLPQVAGTSEAPAGPHASPLLHAGVVAAGMDEAAAAPASSLQGIGSTQIALAPDGSFSIAQVPHHQQQQQQQVVGGSPSSSPLSNSRVETAGTAAGGTNGESAAAVLDKAHSYSNGPGSNSLSGWGSACSSSGVFGPLSSSSCDPGSSSVGGSGSSGGPATSGSSVSVVGSPGRLVDKAAGTFRGRGTQAVQQ